jgi:hypothetical protein
MPVPYGGGSKVSIPPPFATADSGSERVHQVVDKSQ